MTEHVPTPSPVTVDSSSHPLRVVLSPTSRNGSLVFQDLDSPSSASNRRPGNISYSSSPDYPRTRHASMASVSSSPAFRAFASEPPPDIYEQFHTALTPSSNTPLALSPMNQSAPLSFSSLSLIGSHSPLSSRPYQLPPKSRPGTRSPLPSPAVSSANAHTNSNLHSSSFLLSSSPMIPSFVLQERTPDASPSPPHSASSNSSTPKKALSTPHSRTTSPRPSMSQTESVSSNGNSSTSSSSSTSVSTASASSSSTNESEDTVISGIAWLLVLIRKLHNEGVIDDAARAKLKDEVLAQNATLLNAFQKYQINDNRQELIETLLALLK